MWQKSLQVQLNIYFSCVIYTPIKFYDLFCLKKKKKNNSKENEYFFFFKLGGK